MSRVSGVVVGVVAAALIGAAAMKSLESPVLTEKDVEAPLLISSPGRCSADRVVAAHRAREAEREARARVERFPFDLRDGVVAVGLYRESIACARAAGLTGESDRVARALESWSGRLNEDYSTLRLRLRVALDHDRAAEALDAVNELDSLLSNSSGPYRSWLSLLRRELEQRIANAHS